MRLAELAENAGLSVLRNAEEQLQEYFAGKRKSFTIPLDMRGTRLQNDGWLGCPAIPFGKALIEDELRRITDLNAIMLRSTFKVLAK